jgi:hypothetical protein
LYRSKRQQLLTRLSWRGCNTRKMSSSVWWSALRCCILTDMTLSIIYVDTIKSIIFCIVGMGWIVCSK